MKSQVFMIAVFCCALSMQAAQNSHPQTIQITIDASTASDLQQRNKLKQEEQLTSHQQTNVTTSLVHNEPLRRYQPHELKAVNSLTSSVVKKTAAGYAIFLMAGATQPWILPAFACWRVACALATDDPWMDRATPEEAQELAQKGKKRVSEIVVFPLLYQLVRPSGK